MPVATKRQIAFKAGPMDGGAAIYEKNQRIEKVIDVTPDTADPGVIPVYFLHRYIFNDEFYEYKGAFKFVRK
jgi:hypothetical protein